MSAADTGFPHSSVVKPSTVKSQGSVQPKILVVDDRSENLVAMKVILKKLDAELVMVTSGAQALSEILRHEFALILMDVQMSEMDGFETAGLIREYEPAQQVPLIFVTAINKDQMYVQKGYELGAIDYVFKPVDPDILRGKVRGFLDMYREKIRLRQVTADLEQTQEQLQQSYQEVHQAKAYVDKIIGSMAESLIVVDESLTIQAINPATNALLGYAERELLGQSVSQVIADGAFVNNWHQFFSEVPMVRNQELLYRRKDGSTIPVLFSSANMHRADGDPWGFVCLAQDISQQKQNAEELAKARDLALEGMKAKAAFLATMSHEIRTPMNGVIGMAGFLLDSELTDEQRDYAETLKVSGESLLNLINDILDFSKIDAGKLSLETIAFSLQKVVEGVVDLIAIQAHPKGLEVMALIHGQVPMMVEGDPGRLRQILINLLGNSVKFTEEGEIALHVSAVSQDSENIHIQFEVADTGLGMTPEIQTRLFTPFSQGDDSTARKFGGTGLGLSICQKLVKTMNGEIDCESQENQGTKIWFTVPLRLSVPQPGVPLSSLPPIRAAVVMQHPKVAEDVGKHLQGWGSQVQSIGMECDVIPALQLAAQENRPYDLLIIEVADFERFGKPFFQHLRQAGSLTALRVIIVTALGKPGDGKLARELGAAAYLTKPIKQEQLYQALCLVMDQHAPQTDVSMSSLVTRHTIAEQEHESQPRLLLAEDNLVNQKVAVRMLKKLGYQVDVAGDGQEAVDAWAGTISYCAILMDCMMPEMDGYEATSLIRSKEEASSEGVDATKVSPATRIPIIAVTANAFDEDREKCLASGMDDFLAKPLKIEELQAILEKWISVPSSPS